MPRNTTEEKELDKKRQSVANGIILALGVSCGLLGFYWQLKNHPPPNTPAPWDRLKYSGLLVIFLVAGIFLVWKVVVWFALTIAFIIKILELVFVLLPQMLWEAITKKNR